MAKKESTEVPKEEKKLVTETVSVKTRPDQYIPIVTNEHWDPKFTFGSNIWIADSDEDEDTIEDECSVCAAYSKIVDDIAKITRQRLSDSEKLIRIKTIVLRKYMNITSPLFDC